MKLNPLYFSINIVGLLLAIVFCVSVSDPIKFKFFQLDLSSTAGALALFAYLAGAALASVSFAPLLGSKHEQNVEKLKEWKEQDAKLALELQSDKEKQLQAKIATLEAALKQALGK